MRVELFLPLTLAAALTVVSGGGPLTAAQPRLVRDINPSREPYGTSPRDLVELPGRAVFHAEDISHGRELWSSDGTAGGTRRIQDICPGSCSTRFSSRWVAGGRWFFWAEPRVPSPGRPAGPNPVPGWGLWSTDGTPSGTEFLHGGSDAVFLGFVETTGVHWFMANDELHGRELWRTDGTPEGTWRLTDLVPGPADSFGSGCLAAAALGDHLLFAAHPPEGGCELWRSDGSPGGTVPLREPLPDERFSSLTDLITVGDRVVFRASDALHGTELWTSDGTRSGTDLLIEIASGARSASFVALQGIFRVENERAFFLAGSRIVPSGTAFGDVPVLELWQTDGTAAGTHQLTRFDSPRAFRGEYFEDTKYRFYAQDRMTALGPKVYFWADDGQVGQELWVSDGRPAGTHLLRDLCPGECSSAPESFRAIGEDGFVFTATDAEHGREVWISDGTAAGTRIVSDGCPGECSSLLLDSSPLGDRLVFAATSESGGVDRLWITGPAAATATELAAWEGGTAFRDPEPGLTFLRVPMAQVAGELLFSVDDGVHGRELWTTTGSPESTRLLYDLASDAGVGSRIEGLTRHDSRVYFFADDGHRGVELWSSDGTADGTSPVLEQPAQCSTCEDRFHHLTSLGGLLYFWREGGVGADQLWRSDGTSSGTFVLAEVAGGEGSFGELGGETYFASETQLWRTDGTLAGTVPVTEVPFHRAPESFVRLGGELFFHAWPDFRSILWKTDGTSAGTKALVEGLRTEAEGPTSILRAAGKLFFIASEDGGGSQVWASDGTARGTQPVTDLPVPGTDPGLRLLGPVEGRAVFQGAAPDGGYGLWTSDGTPGGMAFLRDFPEGVISAVAGRRRDRAVLYFGVDDGKHGNELWFTDGTPEGTRLVRDIHPGAAPSHPLSLKVIGDRLFFTAFDPRQGRQLWRTDGTAEGTHPVTSVTTGLVYPSSFVDSRISWLDDRLLFAAADHDHGEELWTLPLDGGSVDPPDGGDPPPPPSGPWLTSPGIPGFRFKVRIAQGVDTSVPGAAEPDCIPETLCVSGALAGRSEVFIRVVGPKPNGKLWPTLVKFSTSKVEIWIEQLSSGDLQYYRLSGATPGSSDLPGLFDRTGFRP